MNSLTSRRTTSTSEHCGWQHFPRHRSTNLAVKLTLKQGVTSCPVHLQINFWGPKTRNTYNDHHWVWWLTSSQHRIMHSSTSHWMSGTKESHVPSHRYQILGRETVRKIDYITFPKITPPRLTQQPKTHTHLNAKRTKTSWQEAASEMDQGLRCLRVQLLNGAVLITGKKHRLPIMKEYILKEYSDVFSRVGTLPGEEYHIMLKMNYVPMQHPTKSVPVKIKAAYKVELQSLCNTRIITPVQEYPEWTNSIVPVRKADSILRLCLDWKTSIRTQRGTSITTGP